ncbi:MAG TPA: hypothetical protein VGY66_31530, partial [Gemmataceae bacterium]|nr:hypothetical protein [Gemmataceae bacterium]
GQGGFDYTHIIVCDAFIEVHDSYVGNTQALSANGDILGIPSGSGELLVSLCALCGLCAKRIFYKIFV